ncbi:MAG TPA: NUDIX domain-containing protein, partial [Burkholderiaceae bacterium]
MPALSCGVVIANERGQVFACRATGTRRWDLPKGLADPGEAPRAAAVREAWEEA